MLRRGLVRHGVLAAATIFFLFTIFFHNFFWIFFFEFDNFALWCGAGRRFGGGSKFFFLKFRNGCWLMLLFAQLFLCQFLWSEEFFQKNQVLILSRSWLFKYAWTPNQTNRLFVFAFLYSFLHVGHWMDHEYIMIPISCPPSMYINQIFREWI